MENPGHLRIFLQALQEGVIVLAPDGKILMGNPAAERILGIKLDELLSKSTLDEDWRTINVKGEHLPGEEHPCMIAARTGEPVEGFIMGIRRKTAQPTTWIQINAIPLLDDDTGKPSLVVTSFADITEQVEIQQTLAAKIASLHDAQIELEIRQTKLEELNQKLEVLANRDELTGAWNRRQLMERLRAEIALAHRYGYHLSLLMVDVDHFKAFNDQHGHLIGDALLQKMIEVFNANLRSSDTVFRFGGDEFAIVLPQTKLEEASMVANHLCVAVNGHAWSWGPISVSIGFANFGGRVSSADDLIRLADHALYKAKLAGRNQSNAA